MLTRELVLKELLINQAFRIGQSIIYRLPETNEWRVKTWDSMLHTFDFMNIDEAVDTFIACQPIVEVPDADELRELNHQVKEAEYKQWCEKNQHVLHVLSQRILIANEDGQRTINFDIPVYDTEGNYRRYFEERHYKVIIQKYGNSDYERVMLCKIYWN